MKPVTMVRVFGAVNSVLSILFLVMSWAALQFLTHEFLVARFSMVMMSFLLFAFTVWILIASSLLLLGRRSAWTALFINGAVFIILFGTLAVFGLREQSRHDAGFFAVVIAFIGLVLFGLAQCFAALRPSLRGFAVKEGKTLFRSISPSVLCAAVLLAAAAPSAVLAIHNRGVLRPGFVSAVTASSQTAAHPASAVCGIRPSMFWSPASSGAGSWVRIDFPYSQKIEAVDIRGGASVDEAVRKKMNRIRAGVLTFSNGTQVQFSLNDIAAVQRVSVPASECTWVSLTVSSAYEGENNVLGVALVSPLHRVKVFR